MGKAARVDKYAAILEGALRTFAAHGFHKSQVSKIAKAAGVADGTIYLYFRRKEDILIALFREKLGALVEKLRRELGGADDARACLARLVALHYAELERDVDLAYVTQIELRQSSLELRREIGEALRPYVALIEEVLARGVAQGVFRADLDLKLARQLVFGAMDEAVTSWLVSGRKYSLGSMAEGTASFFARGLGA
jgi:TetR/AcrR family fatty acid metabolism transcriptional regulator